MKKILSFILLSVLGLSLFSCNNDIKLENEISVIAPMGTPYLALGGLLEEENVKIDGVQGADPLKAALVAGEYDVVVAPINLAAQLFNKGNSKYVIDAYITMNNAYIVTDSSNKLDSISDLEGQNVVGFGQTGIPGSVLKKVYADNNLDVNLIDFSLASSSAVYAAYAGGSIDAKYVLMSEPEISKLVINNKKDIKTLDLTSILGVDVPQACILVNPNSEKQDDINNFLKLVDKNIKSLNENPEKYADLIIPLDRSFEAMTKDVIVRSIPLTNIVYKKATSNKSAIENILSILGVGLPSEEFYR